MTTELEHLRDLIPGEHRCLLYDNEEERLAAIAPFMRDGLDRGERFIYIAHQGGAGDVLDRLRAGGLDVDAAKASGALNVVSAQDVYLRDGAFDPFQMISLLRQEAARARADGFTALRVTGEMAWALGGERGCDRLVEYEAVVSGVLHECGVSAICQYDRRLFPPVMQRDLLHMHPVVVLGDQVCHNLYYEPAKFILSDVGEAERVEWMVSQLRRARSEQQRCELALAERDRSVRELEAQRSRLSQLLHQMPAGVVIAEQPHGEIVFANDTAHQMFGCSGDRIEEPLRRSLLGEMLVGEELEAIDADGRRLTLNCNASPLRDSEGKVVAAMVACIDASEKKRSTAERELLLEELRANDRRKDEFLAMLGHELRNPLGAISNGLQVLRRRLKDDSVRHERDVLERQVKHMARLLDDLLDVSRITRGLTNLEKDHVDLSAVIARSVATTSSLMQSRRHQLALSLPPESIPVEGDATRLEQIVVNLLSNAARYTEPGGRVSLSLRREEGQAVIRVRDTGMGIPAELLPRIFEIFTQGERPLDRSQGGLGVGLTLARRLAELHGGSLEAQSDGPGTGSEFIVRLPAVMHELSGVELARLEHVSDQTPPSGSPRVLLVEDNADAAAMLYELLQMIGYDVHVANDGPSGLALAAKVKPDVCVLDIGLPGMDGYEVAQQLRRDPATAGCLLIALTGYGQESDRRRSKESGFDEHLVKPVDVDELDRAIAQVRERHTQPAA